MCGSGNSKRFVRHIYKMTNELQTYTVYKFVESVNGKSSLTDLLRIEKFNKMSNATNIDYYLRLRTADSWIKSEKITGLRPTNKKGVFYGDKFCHQKNQKSLLIFKFSDDRTRLALDFYNGFYPLNNLQLKQIIETY